MIFPLTMAPVVTSKMPLLLTKPIDKKLLRKFLLRSGPGKEPYDPDYKRKKAKKRVKTLAKSSSFVRPITSTPNTVTPKHKKSGPTTISSGNKNSSQLSNCLSSYSFKKQPLTAPNRNSSKSSCSRDLSSTFASLSTPHSEGSSSKSSKRSSSTLTKTPPSVKKEKPKHSSKKSIEKVSKKSEEKLHKKSKKSKKSKEKSPAEKLSKTAVGKPSKVPAKISPNLTKKGSKTSSAGSSNSKSSFPSPSPPKPRLFRPKGSLFKESKVSKEIIRLKECKQANVPKAIIEFKIPKKAKVSPKTEVPTIEEKSKKKSTTVNLAGLSKTSASSSVLPDKTSKSSEPISTEEDLDLLESIEPELGFDLYATAPEEITYPSTEALQENGSQNEEANDDQSNEDGISKDIMMDESCQDDPMDQLKLPFPFNTSLEELESDSDSSDEDANFKRIGPKDIDDDQMKNKDGKPPVRNQIREKQINPSFGQADRLKPPPVLNPNSSSTIVRTSSSTTSTSLSTPSKAGQPTVDQILCTIDNITSPNDAMKKFLDAHRTYPRIFNSSIHRFQITFRHLLLRLFRDDQFLFKQAQVDILFDHMRKLDMDNSYNWEEIIAVWGKSYLSLLTNAEKKDNMIKLVTHVYNHLQTERIPINLTTARLLIEMKHS